MIDVNTVFLLKMAISVASGIVAGEILVKLFKIVVEKIKQFV
jgi:hypothetical protein